MTPEIRVRVLFIEALAFFIGFPVLFSLLAIARG